MTSLADSVAAWNSISGSNSASIFSPPSMDNNFSFVNSSGQSPKFNFGPLAKGLKLGGTFLGAFGAFQQGKEEAGAYNYNADLVMQDAEFTDEELNRYGAVLAGTQRAMYAKAGVTMSGSPLDVMLESATAVERDRQVNQYNAESKVNMLRYQAEVAKNQSKFKMGQALLTGGAGLLLGL